MPTQEYYLKNKEHITETSKKWKENNYARYIQKNKEYRENNPEKIKAKGKKYYIKNKVKLTDKILKYKYKISLEEYNTLLLRQNGVCAICGNKNKTKNLFVDHDHKTGKVRGLLCQHCNTALGFLREDISIFSKIEEYLSKKLAGSVDKELSAS